MPRHDIHLGQGSYTATGKWRCTDIGTRVFVAVELDQDDPRNYNGAPYSIVETTFDEDDLPGCSLDPTEFVDKARGTPNEKSR